WVDAFVKRLRELSWIEGRTVAIEYRWGEGRAERYAEAAADFVRLKVDVILAGGTEVALAAKQATSVIPIVFSTAGDPVGSGLVAVPVPSRRAEDIAPAFEALKGRAEALYVIGDSLVNTHRLRINTFALAARLPTMLPQREYVEMAGLMSYGANFLDLNRRA